jgi:hypothetical protein
VALVEVLSVYKALSHSRKHTLRTALLLRFDCPIETDQVGPHLATWHLDFSLNVARMLNAGFFQDLFGFRLHLQF